MHVLYIVQHYNAPQSARPGGGRAYEMARRLVGMGHTVTLVCGGASQLDDDARASTAEVGIRLVPISTEYGHAFSLSRRVVSFFAYAARAIRAARIVAGVDIVFASSTPPTVGIVGAVAARYHGVPFVFEVRDLWPEVPHALGVVTHPLIVSAAHRMVDAVYRRANRIVALSPGTRDGIVRRGIPTHKVAVVPNAADTEMFRQRDDRQVTRDHYGWDTRLVAVHHGAMGFVNGLGYALDTAAWLGAHGINDIEIALVGEGKEHDALATRIKAERLRQVHIYPAIPRAAVPALLAAADVGLMLTRRCAALEWNSANKFFEYLAAGLPVLVNYGGWQADHLLNAGAGLSVSPHDAASMGRALVELRNQADRRAKMGQAARDLAEKEFDRDMLASRLEGVLVDALRAPAAT